MSPYYRQGPTTRSTPGVMPPPAGAKEADAAEPAPYPRGVFSYWSQRARNRNVNRGLRLDYFLASPAAMPLVSDAFVRDDIYMAVTTVLLALILSCLAFCRLINFDLFLYLAY